MRVLVVGHTYMARINRDKLYELARHDGVEVHLITPKKWNTGMHLLESELFEGENIRVIPLRTMLAGNEAFYFYLPSYFFQIRKIRPDIIHVEQGADAFSYFQTLIARKVFAPKAKCLFFTWVNCEVHNRFPLSFFETFNLRHSDYAICGNREAADLLQRKGFEKPIKVLPQLGVDTELFRRKDVSGLRTRLGFEHFTIGFVGRLVREKGVLDLVEAASRLKDPFHLLMVGSGDLKDAILQRASHLGIDKKVRIIDSVSHEQVVDYLNCLNVLVLPSHTTQSWKEQFGHVLIEAMACEVPVIGSSSAEIPNVIGDAGLVFEEGDVDDLRRRLEALMGDEHLRFELARKGRRRVLERYTHRRIAEETLELYKELMAST
jgi:glycosyltransferase involved in cell wall biosynthesis